MTSPRPGGRQFALNAVASWLANGVKAGTQLALLPLMARLLTPAEFGLYALAQPVVMFFATIADSGIGASLAREAEDDGPVWSTAFWTLLGSYCVMALLVAGSGYPLAAVTGQPGVVGLMAFLSLALPLIALGVVPDARIFRRGDLTLHSWTDLAANLSSAVVAVATALSGWGAWSLAAQYVSGFAVRAVMLNALAFVPPRLEFRASTLRGHVGMSGALVSRRVGDLVGRLCENALFGHAFGPAALGAYSIAQQASRFSCDVLANPLNGALYAHVLRKDPTAARRAHAGVLRVLSLLLLPAATVAAVSAPRLLPIALGPHWSQAAPMFSAIVLLYAFSALSNLNDPMLMRADRTWSSTWVALGAAAARVACVGAAPWTSPVVVAWLVGGTFLAQAVALTSASRPCSSGWREVLSVVAAPALGSAAAAAATALVLAAVDGGPGVAAALASGAAAYAVVVVAVSGHAIRDEVAALRTAIRRPA